MPHRNVAAFVLTLCTFTSFAQQPIGSGWPTYGGDPGGTRFSTSSQITRNNLSHLQPAWTFHTRALESYKPPADAPSFETTPVLSDNGKQATLYLTSPYDVVFAVDARTGTELWHFDPKLPALKRGGIVTSRGVALWPLTADPSPQQAPCTQRVFLATLDARLISLDAATGHPCAAFGNNGSIDLRSGIDFTNLGYYGMTSPPTIVGNTVIVGSYIGDNQQVDIESGAVRGFDVITGKQLWSWEPLAWARSQKVRTGAGNAWSILSADPQLGLVYIPTGSPSPDYYGGMRPGDDRDADSVVALNAATGQKVWAFQTTHHDIWDYDVASEPVLFTWRANTPQSTPAIAITTKMGLIFVLDRRTGQPLYPIHERPVPQTNVRGEATSPTQPFQDLPALSSLDMQQSDTLQTWHRSEASQKSCDTQLASLRNEGIYTPPSIRGSVMFPGNLGGVNWGGAAIDPSTGILYANTNRIAFKARLIPRWSLEHLTHQYSPYIFDWANWGIAAGIVLVLGTLISLRRRRSFIPGPITLSLVTLLMLCTIPISRHKEPVINAHFGYELDPQNKSPYLVMRDVLNDPDGHSCTASPWGVISAVNLNTGTKLWEKPLGTEVPNQNTGMLNFGGPIVTASGLVFNAATDDPWLRIFDATTGDLLHQLPLPAPGVATPMTYTLDGRQYIVIAAGGHGDRHSKLGDSLAAFALEQ